MRGPGQVVYRHVLFDPCLVLDHLLRLISWTSYFELKFHIAERNLFLFWDASLVEENCSVKTWIFFIFHYCCCSVEHQVNILGIEGFF